MRKLRLKLDDLAVESFHLSTDRQHARGTVKGAGQTVPFTQTIGDGGSGNTFCISVAPCVPSNEPTCLHTCPDTCVSTCAPDGQQCA